MVFVTWVLIFLGIIIGQKVKNAGNKYYVPVLIVSLIAGVLLWRFVQLQYAVFFFGIMIPGAEILWERLKDSFTQT